MSPERHPKAFGAVGAVETVDAVVAVSAVPAVGAVRALCPVGAVGAGVPAPLTGSPLAAQADKIASSNNAAQARLILTCSSLNGRSATVQPWKDSRVGGPMTRIPERSACGALGQRRRFASTTATLPAPIIDGSVESEQDRALSSSEATSNC